MPAQHRSRGGRHALAEFEPLAPAGRLSKLAFVLIAVLLFFEAFAHGAVEAWSELAALVLSGLLVVVLLLRHVLDRESRPPSTWLWVPLGLFAAFAALQAIPLPAAWTGWLAPTNLARKQELLGSGDLTMAAISYYPRETWRLLRMTLIGGSLFAAAVTLGRERGGVTRLLALMFVVGAGEAVLSLAQIVSQSDWTYAAIGRETRGLVTAGSFLNYSNYSQFINLAIGAGLGLLLVRSEHRRRVTGRTPSWEDFWKSEGWIVAGLAFCCLSVFTSMSRNGVLSMAAAGGVFLLMLQWRRSSSVQAWALVSLPLVVFLGLCVVGFDAVYDRLGSLSQEGVLTDRWQLTLDTLHVWQDHPLFGIGLSAHEYAFSPYDTTGSLAIAQTADNDYAQILEEVGLIGVTLIVVVLATLAWQILALTGSSGASTSLAAYGATFGLVAVAVHSWTDFGQRIPAVFSLTALLVGVVIAAGHRERRHRQDSTPTTTELTPAQRRLRGVTAALVLLPIWASALVVAVRAAQAEEAWAKAYQLEVPLYERNWLGSVEEYSLLLQHAQAATAFEPNNVRYAFRLNLYRWQSMLMAGQEIDQAVTRTPEFQSVTGSLVDALSQNRQLCPTFGPPYALEGQLRYSVLGDTKEGRRQILAAAELAPNDTAALLNVGRIHAAEGDLDLAHQALHRLVSLRSSYFNQAADLLVTVLNAPDAAERLCGDSPERLEALSKLYAQAGEPVASRAPGLRQQASQLLEQRAETNDASPRELAKLAQIAQSQGEHENAVQLYRKALAVQYSNVGLRLELAKALRDAKLLDEAMEEVRVCRRLRPHHEGAIRLESELWDLLHQDAAPGQ